jgi:hypothetical protein
MSVAAEATRMGADPDRVRAAVAELYPADPVTVRETHISWVFLTRERAFKLKKPLVLSFLAYGTAARRRPGQADDHGEVAANGGAVDGRRLRWRMASTASDIGAVWTMGRGPTPRPAPRRQHSARDLLEQVRQVWGGDLGRQRLPVAQRGAHARSKCPTSGQSRRQVPGL